MEPNTTQKMDFLGAYQACLKTMETGEFPRSLFPYYLEITEALYMATKNQSKPKSE